MTVSTASDISVLTAAQAVGVAQRLAVAFAARANDADIEGRLPQADIDALKTSGYLGMSVPREYGGAGLTLRQCLDAHLELAKSSTSTALVAAMHLHTLGHASETRPWDEQAFAAICQAAARGELVNAVASEPKLGSPSRGGLPETTATVQGDTVQGDTVQGDVLVIDGHKNWTTGGEHLNHLVVRVALVDGDDAEGAMVWVPASSPGIRVDATWSDSLSLRASDSHDMYFENVRIPKANILQRDSQKAASNTVWFPMLMAATYFGAALAARDTVVKYALERVPTALGKAIATLPKIQRQIGEVDIALQAAQGLLLSVADEWQGIHPNTPAATRAAMRPKVAAAKHLATETALSVTEQCLKIAGGASIGRELPLERYFRDVRAGMMHPPSGDSALELVGRAALGL
jgi:alkylation response protein AidB-like acyl-CoA dehydrogenase